MEEKERIGAPAVNFNAAHSVNRDDLGATLRFPVVDGRFEHLAGVGVEMRMGRW